MLTLRKSTNVGDIAVYLGPKAEVGAIVKGGGNLGIYILANKSTGKVEVSGSLGGEVTIFPMATKREDISSAYFSYGGNASLKEAGVVGISGSFNVLIPTRNGQLVFDSGVGVNLGGSASLGPEVPASISAGASGGVNTKWIPIPFLKADYFNKFRVKEAQKVIDNLDRKKIMAL